jgi:hypothetical protein
VTADLDAQAAELLERTRAAQGLPLTVDDDRTIDRVAAIVRSARTSSSAPTSMPSTADGGARSARPEPAESSRASGQRGGSSVADGAAPPKRRAS